MNLYRAMRNHAVAVYGMSPENAYDAAVAAYASICNNMHEATLIADMAEAEDAIGRVYKSTCLLMNDSAKVFPSGTLFTVAESNSICHRRLKATAPEGAIVMHEYVLRRRVADGELVQQKFPCQNRKRC